MVRKISPLAIAQVLKNDPTGNANTVTPLVQTPSIQLVKSARLDTNNTNTVIYGFIVENTGNVELSNIRISDPKLKLNDVALMPPRLNPGATGTIAEQTYAITQAERNAGRVVNTATVSAEDTQFNRISDQSSTPNNPGGDDATTIMLAQNPALQLIKSGTVSSADSNTIVYDFIVENTGNVGLRTLTISDAKLGISELAVSPSNLMPGETGTVSSSYTITQADRNNGQVVNTATVSGSDPQNNTVTDQSSTPNNPGGDDSTTTMLEQNPALQLIKSGTVSSADSNTIVYDFIVENTGNVGLRTLTISDAKLGISELAVSPSNLMPGETGTVSSSYTITQADRNNGQVVNTATVSGSDPQNNTVTDQSSTPNNPGGDDSTTTMLEQNPALQLIKSGTVSSADSNTIVYDFIVENTGNVGLRTLTISDAKLGISELAVSPSNLMPGETGTVSSSYTITQADRNNGQVVNTATVSGSDPQGDPVYRSIEHAPAASPKISPLCSNSRSDLV